MYLSPRHHKHQCVVVYSPQTMVWYVMICYDLMTATLTLTGQTAIYH